MFSWKISVSSQSQEMHWLRRSNNERINCIFIFNSESLCIFRRSICSGYGGTSTSDCAKFWLSTVLQSHSQLSSLYSEYLAYSSRIVTVLKKENTYPQTVTLFEVMWDMLNVWCELNQGASKARSYLQIALTDIMPTKWIRLRSQKHFLIHTKRLSFRVSNK